MNEPIHYTEEDFQNYFDDNFGGDLTSFESHLGACELCAANFKAYSSVWLFTKNDLKTEPLKIDLAYVVSNKVFPLKESKPVFEKYMYGLFICLGAVCVFLCFKYLVNNSVPMTFILLTIPFCLYLLLTYKEIRIISQKFTLSSKD